MESADVINLYKKLESLGVEIWLDGGWGVDALLGEQSRSHNDVDITIQEKDLPALRDLLKSQGYKNLPQDDTSDWNFVLSDEFGRKVDVHVVVFDKSGNGIYGPAERGVMYPADAFAGVGEIDGVKVKCLTAKYQIESHSGYELKEKDYADIVALKEKFNLSLPNR